MGLVQIDQDLWVRDGTFSSLGAKGSTRMTILRIGGDLLAYSPVRICHEDVIAIKKLGEMRWIVAPNSFHHLFVNSFHKAFPGAEIRVSSALAKKKPSLPPHKLLSDVPLDTSGTVEQLEVQGHGLCETVLFHNPSATLITADLLYNLGEEHNSAERLFFRIIRAYGHPCVPFYASFVVKDKTALGKSIQTISAWPIRRIIMAHGDIVEDEKASQIFRDAWGRFVN